MAWGIEGWGFSPWGGGGGGGGGGSGFFVVKAIPQSASVVRVYFSEQPRVLSPIFPGDASKITNWQILDSSNHAEFIIGVRATDETNAVELLIAGRFKNELYQAVAANLIAHNGDPLVAPYNAFFSGCALASVSFGVTKRTLYDIRNPVFAPNTQNGAFVVDSSHQYELESGRPLRIKLILRRCTTCLNEFKHLIGKNYGLGLKEKEVFRFTDFAILKADIETEAKKEDGVIDCTAAISFNQGSGPQVLLFLTDIDNPNETYQVSVPTQQ